MAEDLQRLIELGQSFDPSFILRTSSSWGADIEDSRLQIRRDIGAQLPAPRDIEDLNRRPQLDFHSVSISHAPGLGGWASVGRPHRLGFDLELVARITHKVIERVSTDEELNRSPQPALLWSAKESAFKALEVSLRPSVISKITIGRWRPLGIDLFNFDLADFPSATGYALKHHQYIYSLCLIKTVSS